MRSIGMDVHLSFAQVAILEVEARQMSGSILIITRWWLSGQPCVRMTRSFWRRRVILQPSSGF